MPWSAAPPALPLTFLGGYPYHHQQKRLGLPQTILGLTVVTYDITFDRGPRADTPND